jgi:hypothetical protein
MPSPRFNLPCLLAELFGEANDKSRFLMISDGGHFENLAVYELIRRKCHVIIASDGECDPNLAFEGLGTLIRVCEVDFGVTITLDVAALRPGADPRWSSNRCAVGRIQYGSGIPDGILIYFKASMTGHEDTSVLQYKATHSAFPHETTGDQFYGEDQFESYRHLGREIAHKTLERVGDPTAVAEMPISTIAEMLLGICSPTLDRVGRFTEHTTRLMQLWETIGSNNAVAQLDDALFVEPLPAESRAALYLCCEMLQLMENVYLDLSLDDTWQHPDNSGWRVMFAMWAKAPAIQATWRMSGSIYGRRFQYFCDRHLGLPLPSVGSVPAPKEQWT